MLWHDKRVNKAWCTLTILFLFLPSAIVALVPVRKGVVSADVCLQASANIMLIFATYLFLKRLFRERRIVCFHCKRSLCESNEVTISFNNTTYRDFCHHLVSRTTSIGNGSVFSPPTSCFVLCCVWETDWMYKGPCRRPRKFLVSQSSSKLYRYSNLKISSSKMTTIFIATMYNQLSRERCVCSHTAVFHAIAPCRHRITLFQASQGTPDG